MNEDTCARTLHPSNFLFRVQFEGILSTTTHVFGDLIQTRRLTTAEWMWLHGHNRSLWCFMKLQAGSGYSCAWQTFVCLFDKRHLHGDTFERTPSVFRCRELHGTMPFKQSIEKKKEREKRQDESEKKRRQANTAHQSHPATSSPGPPVSRSCISLAQDPGRAERVRSDGGHRRANGSHCAHRICQLQQSITTRKKGSPDQIRKG